jgi:hypothetical protein
MYIDPSVAGMKPIQRRMSPLTARHRTDTVVPSVPAMPRPQRIVHAADCRMEQEGVLAEARLTLGDTEGESMAEHRRRSSPGQRQNVFLRCPNHPRRAPGRPCN